MNSKEEFNQLWVVIPAYNEEKRISKTLENTLKVTKNIIVVSDGSSDKTNKIVLNHKIKLVTYKINKGKGYALRKGCTEAIKMNAKYIAFMDADGQHSPLDLKRFLADIIKSKSDVVLGYRKLNKKMPTRFKVGNFGLNLIINTLFGTSVKDSQSGYRLIKANSFNKIKWKANDYFLETEMIRNISKHKLKYSQIGIKTIYLDHNKGTNVKTGISIGINILKLKLGIYHNK